MDLADGVGSSLGGALRNSSEWTLALDESGKFEEGAEHLVLGGVLLPGTPEQSRRLARGYLDWCREHLAGKSHATDVVKELKAAQRVAAADAVAAAGGSWLFVVADAWDRDELRASVGSYVRLLAATVDLAGRLAAYCGVKTLHLRPAQRTIPLQRAAIESGYVSLSPVQNTRDSSKPLARPMAEAEVRSALEALAREPCGNLPPTPASGSVRATSANRDEAENVEHPGMLLADVGCNGVWHALREGRASLAKLLEPFQPGLLVPLLSTSKVRSIDRAFRETPAALVRGAKAVAELRANTLGRARNAGDKLALRQGADMLARLIWSEATRCLAGTPDAVGRARLLAALAEVELQTYSGSYEGLALALESGWYGQGQLAAEHRASVPTRELAGRLWQSTFACANHRGDHLIAREALKSFEQIAMSAQSLHLSAEALDIRIEAVVAQQNAFPCQAESVATVGAELERSTVELLELARASERGSAAPPPITRTDSELERKLWLAGAGSEPAWQTPNRQLGMSLGTAARSRAFLGRLDEASALAFEARARFDSPFDLTMNAAYIARIELERARLEPAAAAGRAGFLAAALGLCGATALVSDPDGAQLLGQRLASRFAFDIAIRALLWAPEPPFKPTFLMRWLAEDSFVAAVSRGEMRSHPSELMTRHGAELLRAKGMEKPALRLFDVSLDLCATAAPSTTLARFVPFTERLRAESQFRCSGPPGSLLNPTFEYR